MQMPPFGVKLFMKSIQLPHNPQALSLLEKGLVSRACCATREVAVGHWEVSHLALEMPYL